MPLLSVTRLRVLALPGYPEFLWHGVRSFAQARRSPGFLDGRIRLDARRAFWTLTAWADGEAMLAYRNAPPHQQAMRRIGALAGEAAFAHWTQDEAALPPWPEAERRLRAAPSFTRLPRPAPDHREGRVP